MPKELLMMPSVPPATSPLTMSPANCTMSEAFSTALAAMSCTAPSTSLALNCIERLLLVAGPLGSTVGRGRSDLSAQSVPDAGVRGEPSADDGEATAGQRSDHPALGLGARQWKPVGGLCRRAPWIGVAGTGFTRLVHAVERVGQHPIA